MRPAIAQGHDLRLFGDLYDLERVRQVLRRELKVHGGQAGLAREIGISRGSLRKFLNDLTIPTHPVTERLVEWTADRPEGWTPPGAVAVTLLVHDLPRHLRGPAHRRLLETFAAIHTEAGVALPEWVAAALAP